MTETHRGQCHLWSTIFVALLMGCSTNRAETTPKVALSPASEGLPPEPRTDASIRSPRMSGDTLICETSRKFRTSAGNRWLWVRTLIERKPGGHTDYTVAETVVSTDPEGLNYGKVDLAGVSLDGGNDYTLRNTTGVRTGETKKSADQAHHARGYTVGPNMGPIEGSCGGAR